MFKELEACYVAVVAHIKNSDKLYSNIKWSLSVHCLVKLMIIKIF